jgi:serine protease Do
MVKQVLKPFMWLGIFILIVSLACGPNKTAEAPRDTPMPVVTKAPTKELPPTQVPTPVPASGAVNSLDGVQSAIIQIEAQGTFVDPEEGWNINVGKYGSGVIIDSTGLAVTNNHVVTGAALLRVWVGGDSTKVYNAKVLGVSECSDLAVIDIEGDGFPFVEWYDGDIKVGTDVYAAGFPLADPEYTLTKGIISKANANGESSWASVDYVIEHSARINPGNSGGPLVTADGKLVGINYAGISEYDQNFAISRDEAIPVIDTLSKKKNVNSIGVNGLTVSGTVGDIPIYGVWVRSVASGSPADKALIQPGDIIYQLEGQVLATDGTMKDYCDILKSRDATDTMSVTVIRWSDLSLLEGQLNGRQLATTGYFTADTSGSTGGGTGTTTSGDWMLVTDDSGAISVEIPSYWVEGDGSAWFYGSDEIGVQISAAPVLQDFYDYYDAEGVFFGASPEFAKYGGYVQFLDYYTGPDGVNYRSNCAYNDTQRYAYDDGVYRGKYDYFYNCGGSGGHDAYVLSAVSKVSQGDYIIIIIVQVPPGDGVYVDPIVQHIWDTFLVGRL